MVVKLLRSFSLSLLLILAIPSIAYAADNTVGNEVRDTANSTLTRSGSGTAGSPYLLQLNLGNTNTWTALQTFDATLDANSAVTLGDNGDSVEIDSNDWDISTSGNMAGIGNITADGTLTFSSLLNCTALETNGSGVVLCGTDDTGSAGIGGSGTTNFVSKFSSATTVMNSSIYDNGNIGIGTTAPGQKLDVVAGDINVAFGQGYRIGNTAGNGLYLRGNGTRFVSGAIQAGDLPSSIRGWADTGVAVVTSNSSDNVGIGVSLPGEKLDVGGGNGRVESGFNWLTTSDARFKTNITVISDALAKVLGLRGVRYDLIREVEIVPDQGKQIGFIAQELETQLPELVCTDEEGVKSVAYDKVTAVLVEAIKEQQKQINELSERVKKLKESAR